MAGAGLLERRGQSSDLLSQRGLWDQLAVVRHFGSRAAVRARHFLQESMCGHASLSYSAERKWPANGKEQPQAQGPKCRMHRITMQNMSGHTMKRRVYVPETLSPQESLRPKLWRAHEGRLGLAQAGAFAEPEQAQDSQLDLSSPNLTAAPLRL